MRTSTILLGFLLFTGSVAMADEPGLERSEGVADSQNQASDRAAQDVRASMGIERAEGEKLSAAVGHYARARSLIIAAIREFDAGTKIASPDVMLNSKEWRISLIDRASELERLLDPQPKVTKGGIRYSPDSRLLGGSYK